MKKIAILTQPLHTNYGGTLQAYALQKVVNAMDADVVTLNYQWKQRSFFRLILSILKSHLLNRVEKFPFFLKEKIVREKYHTEFIEKNINRSEILLSENDLLKHFNESNYDAVIVGSDQVWRVEYSPNINNFFLNFVDDTTKKIAYAGSFGIDEWQFSSEKTAQIKKWLEKFDAISVREDSAVTLFKKHLGLDVKHVLDPTLLLSKNDYEQLIEIKPKFNNKIFTYMLDNSDQKISIITKISDKLGLETFKKQPEKIYKTEFFVKNEEEYVYPKIEDWLSSFRDSSFIITDSFHGTVFSIIFNKPFIAIANSERGSARFTSLLRKFNLESRLITNYEDFDESLIDEDIDFDEVNKQLYILRESSINFINNALLFNAEI